MKNIRKFVLVILAASTAMIMSCADPDSKPIITFDDATKGAYARLLEEGSTLVDLLDISGSEYFYSIEFVDVEQGNLVSQFVIDLVYTDNNTGNGDESTTVANYRVYEASTFETNANGFQGLSNLTFAATDLISDLGITQADILPGDLFTLRGKIIMNDGSEYTADNSSAAVNGAAFRGVLSKILTASCASMLDGTVNWEITAANWAGAVGTTGSIDWVQETAGVYILGSYTFGFYQFFYGCCEQDSESDLRITDICNNLTLSAADGYGCPWTFSVDDVSGATMTVTFTTGCGGGSHTVAMTRADGADWAVVAD